MLLIGWQQRRQSLRNTSPTILEYFCFDDISVYSVQPEVTPEKEAVKQKLQITQIGRSVKKAVDQLYLLD